MRINSGEIHQQVVNLFAERYARPHISNSWRGEYIEAIVAEILGPNWKLTWQLTNSNWSAWDIENESTGKKIEVKHSAACQSWHSGQPNQAVLPRFDIKEVDGYYDSGDKWVDLVGYQRPADIYVFAWNGVSNPDEADHRDLTQWEFYIVSSGKLPRGQKTIGLKSVRKIAVLADCNTLTTVVDRVISSPDTD